MHTSSELVHYIVNQATNKYVTTLYLNGGPGTGKSYLLAKLLKELPQSTYRSHILGPYSLLPCNTEKLARMIAQDCYEAGFLIDLISAEKFDDEETLQNVFHQLTVHNQNFTVLVDIGNTNSLPIQVVANFFSQIRAFEGAWESGRIQVHFIITGYWDPFNLDNYYRESQISFPYTTAYNYFHWYGFDEHEISKLIQQYGFVNSRHNHGKVLHELTGGHPGACCDILELIPKNKLSLASMLYATHRAAESGKVARDLLIIWRTFSTESKNFMVELILKRQLSARILPELKSLFLATSLVHEVQRGSQIYLSFRSWYIELVVRLHAAELDIRDTRLNLLQLSELMPEIVSLNNEAYEIIYDIENQIRNFVVLQLCIMQLPGKHILDIEVPQRNGLLNLYDKAYDWQKRSLEKDLPADLNPLVTFLTTRELARLVAVIAEHINSSEWRKIAKSIQDMAYLRDSVMHNQLVDFPDLDKLVELQTQVYLALNQI